MEMFCSGKIRLLIGFSCFVFTSCLLKNEKKIPHTNPLQLNTTLAVPKDSSIAKGIVHSSITCTKDAAQTYALYLPSSYSRDKMPAGAGGFPIIYFFDSHADGALPVEKYYSLAEKYNFIIAGSNNSKNGTPQQTTNNILDFFFEDTKRRFYVDNRRIYTGGFSGGARIAGSAPLTYRNNNMNIAGVIGCGAGFPDNNGSFAVKFDFIGIAGNADFNLVEMKNLDRTLAGSTFVHQLLVFNGKHEWPPLEIMEEAFRILEIAAMKKGLVIKNDSLIQQYILAEKKKISENKKGNRIIESWNIYRCLSENLYDLTDITEYKTQLISIERSPEFLAALNREIESEKSEIEMQQAYTKFFTSKDVDWWKKEIKLLKNSKNPDSQRLIGYLGLMAYMYSVSALNGNMLAQADIFLSIYALLEPENFEHQYLRAQLWMKLNQPDNALNSLKDAVKSGFQDVSRLQNDTVFMALRDMKPFKEIELRLKR